MERMAESSKGTVDHFGKNITFVNVLRNMSVSCDCEGVAAAPVVTHEMGFAREVGTRVLFVDEGIIKEENTPNEFFSHPQNPRLQDFLSKVL